MGVEGLLGQPRSLSGGLYEQPEGLTGILSGRLDELSGTLSGQLLRGYSAYDIAKAINPEIGTEEEWLASLKGEKGDPGNRGVSIESITLNEDCTLTILMDDGTEYVTGSVKGEKGDKGEPGEQGESYILTQEDKVEIYNLLLNEYPAVEEVSF